MTHSPIAAFDRVAASYDRTFTDSRVGRTLRGLVWTRLLEIFPPGGRLLELNCGTGEDASFLAARGFQVTATDGSGAMLDETRRKAASRGLEARVRLRTLDLEDPRGPFEVGSFDGAFSNFGGLNCVADPAPLAAALARWLRPGARAVLVVMGPVCLWEIASSIFRARFRTAFRRLFRRTALARVGGVEIPVRYPWPSELARSFTPHFQLQLVEGVGVALPPSARESLVQRRPRLFHTLEGLEGFARVRWPFRVLGDHYLLVLRRID